MIALFAMLNGWEMVAILTVVLVMFGAKRLPEMARGLGQGLREFRKASHDEPNESNEPTDKENERKLIKNTERKLENDKSKTEFI